METGEDTTPTALENIFRAERGRVLSSLRRLSSSLEEAEDWLSAAIIKALEKWPGEGVPTQPGAWLLTVAKNEGLQRLRHRKMADGKKSELELAAEEKLELGLSSGEEGDYPDERLPLLFTCCHPSLQTDAQIALTLSTLSGLTTREIARAFLVTETTLAQRLVRAKAKIRKAGIPYEVPAVNQLSERVEGVLHVIYLIFTEGYRASQGPARIRLDLCEDALLLAEAFRKLLPEDPEVLGLASLLWLHHARRAAREGSDGEIVYLEFQNRALFVDKEIRRGEALLHQALEKGAIGPYQLQAAIAAQHCLAPRFQDTPWETIISLYDSLYRLNPSPVIALNRAGAIGIGRGPEAGLAEIERLGLARSLSEYAPYHGARGELLRKAGRLAHALNALRRALELTVGEAEKKLLESKIGETLERMS